MVYGVVQNVRAALQQRGGWRGLFNHMYTNGDYPFKFGTHMGTDAAGNKYYENLHDYPFGQHRWVEPGDIHNFDSTSIPPEWHGWMTSMNDEPPSSEERFFQDKTGQIPAMCNSSVDAGAMVGYQNKIYNFHHMHNQSQIRSRGFNIGNPVVGLPPGAPDAYYTQPGSPYNPASMRKTVMIGDLDEAKGGGRPYKSEKWAERLRTPEEKEAILKGLEEEQKRVAEILKAKPAVSSSMRARLARGGTIAGKK